MHLGCLMIRGRASSAEQHHAAGFSDQEIITMIISNSRLLAGPRPASEAS